MTYTSTRTAISDWEQFKTILEKSTSDPVKQMVLNEKALSYAQGLVDGNITAKPKKNRKRGL